MDLPLLTPVISKLLERGVLDVLLLYAVMVIWKKLNETQEKRVQDSHDSEKTVTIALDTVTQKMEDVDETMKSILITLEKKNDKA